MRLNKKYILGVPITVSKKDVILEEIEKYLEKDQRSKIKDQRNSIKPLVIFTPNPEIITYAQSDQRFKEIVGKAQITIPDGQGVVWALKHLHKVSASRLSGVDFVQDLARLSAKKGFRIGLIGGSPTVALKTSECLQKTHPSLITEVFDAPQVRITNHESKIKNSQKNTSNFYDSLFVIHNSQKKELGEKDYFDNLVKELEKRRIDILLVALGHPKQEYFIKKIKDQRSKIKDAKPIILMAVGGAFDYLSGKVSRAPAFMRDLGLEWLYRLVREPQRIRRQLQGSKFFLKVLFSS